MNDWLKHLTAAELAYWHAKQKSETDWWDANTKPEDRQQLLRGEISGKVAYERLLRLPSSTREAILKDLAAKADAARIRLAALGYGAANHTSPIEKVSETSFSNCTTLEDYQNIVSAFSDLVADHRPLIGDCSVLPQPKKTILYAICWVRDHLQTLQEETEDETLAEKCSSLINTLTFLLAHLTADWHDILPEDKNAVEKLGECDSFPDWALPLKAKYINDENASKEAYGVAFQVLKDKVDQESGRGR
jgi:hypothetical protein